MQIHNFKNLEKRPWEKNEIILKKDVDSLESQSFGTYSDIETNTITANEILANTITAGQIAAGTITANEYEELYRKFFFGK